MVFCPRRRLSIKRSRPRKPQTKLTPRRHFCLNKSKFRDHTKTEDDRSLLTISNKSTAKSSAVHLHLCEPLKLSYLYRMRVTVSVFEPFYNSHWFIRWVTEMDSFSAKLKLSDEMVLVVVRRHLELSTKRAKMCYFGYQHQKNKCALAFILFFQAKVLPNNAKWLLHNLTKTIEILNAYHTSRKVQKLW